MADYSANIRLFADSKQAEAAVKKLSGQLEDLQKKGGLTFDFGKTQRQVDQLKTSIQGIGARGAFGALTLGLGKATTAVGALSGKFGLLGAAAVSAGGLINNALGGVPAVVGDILNQVGHLPNAFGIAAVAAMAFAPQVSKAASAAVGLGTAIDKAIGGETTNKIAKAVESVGRLNMELEAVKATFASLIEGSTLNELNSQLRDAVEQSGAFHSSTQEAVTAAEQLVSVQREQAREQKAINDLIRKAQGLQPQDVRDAEVARRASALKTRELQQRRDAQLQNQINAELAEYERLAEQVAAQTKQWANNLDRIARSSRSGVLGSSSQIRARLEEMRQNRNSADIARQRSAELLALEARQTGGNYSLSQVPARGELFPGGNSLSAAPQYRAMLNAQAQMRQAAASALAQSERTVLGFQAQTLRTEKDITAAKLQQQAIDQRSIQIARERNKLLLEQYRAEQRNPNFSLTGANAGSTLDRASRVADLRRRKKRGEDIAAQGENIALGVGFPLLFGGGAGTTLGSLAGSFVGTGFGGQILGGAIGQIVDQFVTATTDLGRALLDTTRIFDTLKEASLISSRGLEKTITRLQEAGFAATASATAQRDFAEIVGRDGARNLLALGDAADRGSRAFAEAVTRFQARIAGPLGRAQGFLARGGEISNLQNRVGDVAGQLQRSGRNREAQQLLAAANPFASVGKSQDQVISELQEALKKAEQSLPPLKIRLDAKQIRDELLTTLNKQLEAIDLSRGLVQQVRERARAQEDLDTQRADMLLQQERAIGDLRRSIEDRIADIRLSNVQRENELLDVQAQIRLQSLKNSNIDLRGGFTNEQVSGAANAVADYLEAELQTANDAAKIKRDAALEVQRLDIEAERFKLQTAIQVSRLNQDTAKQVASIQRNVFRQNQDQDNRRFELEKRIAQLKLDSLAAELALVTRDPSADRQIRETAFQTYNAIQLERKRVGDLKAPGTLRFNASGLGGVGVSTSGVDAANAQAKQLLLNLEAAKQALLDLVSSGNLKQLQESLDNTFVKPLQKAQDEANGFWETVLGTGVGMINNDQAKKESALGGLLTQLGDLIKQTNDPKVKALLEGIAGDLPAMTRETDAAVTTSELLGTLQDDLAGLQDRYIALQTPTGELTKSQQIYNELVRNNISLESERAKKLLELAGVYDQVNAQVTEQERMQQSLNELYSGISGELVNGVSRSLDLVAQSTENVGEAMRGLASDILRTVGKMLIFQGLAQLFGGILGGGSANPQGIFSSIGKAFGYAEGGFVTRPTNAVIGEGGQPEYVIPANKMRGAISRYSAGARGSAVIPSGSESGEMGGTATMAPASIDVRYTVERINSVDYVTADQFQAGLQQAAAQGAERGQQLALRRLQQSPSTRRRVGI